MMMKYLIPMSCVLLACSNPAPKDAKGADTAVAQAAKPSPAKPARRALANVDGETVYEDQMSEQMAQHIKSHDAQAALRRWQLVKSMAREVAMEKALAKAAKAQGMGAEEYERASMERLGSQPVTPEILKAVYEGNKDSLGHRPFEEVKEAIRSQLEEQFGRDAKREFRRQLLNRYKFEDRVPVPVLPRFKAASPTAPTLGPDSAPVTVVVFSDFECPHCARQAMVVTQMAQRFGSLVRWQFRHFPLSFHENARKASRAAICAHRQDRFWPFHDRIFERRFGYDPAGLKAHAEAVGVGDAAAFATCLKDEKALDQIIDADLAAGEALGVTSTPSVYLNGMPVHGVAPELFGELVDAELRSLGHNPPTPPEPRLGPPGGEMVPAEGPAAPTGP